MHCRYINENQRFPENAISRGNERDGDEDVKNQTISRTIRSKAVALLRTKMKIHDDSGITFLILPRGCSRAWLPRETRARDASVDTVAILIVILVIAMYSWQLSNLRFKITLSRITLTTNFPCNSFLLFVSPPSLS